ncbi:MAG TPA: DUF4157 domain-containing protein [Anaerolineae bacterium]|nr:DUF4157 domain-containing protein [Anaerolineae bacterium]
MNRCTAKSCRRFEPPRLGGPARPFTRPVATAPSRFASGAVNGSPGREVGRGARAVVSDEGKVAPVKVERARTPCDNALRRVPAAAARSRPSLPVAMGSLSSGQPLSPAQRNYFEPRFGFDFSAVRIHADQRAAQAADAVDARAFTLGRDIAFAAGQYQPQSSAGRQLLAHELTHVVQQSDRGGALIQRAPRCTPAPGYPPSRCFAYLANSYWLPLAYVNNATCACLATPNSPTANCVRKFLQDRLAATPTWLKTWAAAQKALEFSQPAAYQAFVQAVITPRVYRDHVDAYRHCCCPSGPAGYWSWIGVTTVPIQPCSLVGDAIRWFGSCHGTPGRW